MVSFVQQDGTECGDYLRRHDTDRESAFLGATPAKGMATVCLQCGDRGFDDALIYCDDCKKYAVHRYCLETLTFDDDGVWFCEDCQPEIGKPDSNGEVGAPMERKKKKKRRSKNWKWKRVKYGRKRKMLKPRT